MYRKIFCPVDGSEVSNRGLLEAILFAQDQHACLALLHVVDYSPLTQYGPTYGLDFDAYREAGKATLDAAVKQARDHDLQVESHLAEIMSGGPGDTIVKEAGKCNADLIVMGSHGRRGLTRLVMGSDAAAVLAQSPIPVLLVK